MNNNIKTVIRILGNDYTITTNESEEFVQRVTYLINKKFNEITMRNNRLSTNLIATFASINIAEECLKYSDKNNELVKQMEDNTEQMNRMSAEMDSLRSKNEALSSEVQKLKIQIAKLEARK